LLWFIVGFIFFLLVHRVVENTYVSECDSEVRKFQFDMGTAVFFLLAGFGFWVFALLSGGSFLSRWGLVMVFLTPVYVIVIAAYSYASYLKFTEVDRAEEAS